MLQERPDRCRTRARTRRDRAVAGFTLIELIVVLAIIAAVLAIAMPNFRRGTPGLEMAAAAHRIAATLRLTRSRAIAQNQPMRFIAETGTGTFAIDGGGSRQRVPAGMRLSLTTTRDQALPGGIGTIRFYPDGSSSGGGVLLSEAGLSYSVTIDWLDGDISVRAGAGRG